MAKKDELIAEAKSLGIEIPEGTHHFAIAAMIKKAKEANGPAHPPPGDGAALPNVPTMPNTPPLTTGQTIGGGVFDPTLAPHPTFEPLAPRAPMPGDPTPGHQSTPQPPEPINTSDSTPEPQPRFHAPPTVPFDINKLTPEQLKQLKAKLDETPHVVSSGRSTITVRRFNGKFVIGIKNSSSKTVLDPIEQKAVTKITIPVLYYGAADFVVEDYKDFMTSERVACEVVSQREVRDRIIEGVVYSMELKKEVEQVCNTVVRFYTIKLPNGEQIELFEDAVNL